jgi:hypothetical protein
MHERCARSLDPIPQLALGSRIAIAYILAPGNSIDKFPQLRVLFG